MKVNQISGLNRQAKKFLLENCVSRKGVEVMASGFTGYINGQNFENVTLIREYGKWIVFKDKEYIQSIYGDVNCFLLTKKTLGL